MNRYLEKVKELERRWEAETSTASKCASVDEGGETLTTPQRILVESRCGCLTFGGLRDRLVIAGCDRETAETVIGMAEELGQIVVDGDGLVWPVH